MTGNTLRIAKHVLLDIFRSKILLLFTAFMLAVCFGIFALESSIEKALFGLTNLVLFFIPLFVSLFTSVYVYNNAEFIQLMLSQPVRRRQLFFGLFFGISSSLSTASVGALMLPIMLYGAPASGWLLVGISFVLLLIFAGISMWISIAQRDKSKGLGIVLLTWLGLTFVYDGLMLLVVLIYADYPLETVTIVLTTLNPIDIARILLLMNLDQSALLGFTGVFFTQYFGSFTGILVGACALLFWIIAPAGMALRKFNRTDW